MLSGQGRWGSVHDTGVMVSHAPELSRLPCPCRNRVPCFRGLRSGHEHNNVDVFVAFATSSS